MRKFPYRAARISAMLLAVSLAVALGIAGCGKPDGAGPSSDRSASRTPPAQAEARRDRAEPDASAVAQPPLKLVQKEITLQWVEKGVLRTSVTAKRVGARVVTDRGDIVGEVEGFSAKLYENGKLSATMTAPKAVVDTPRRTITATGGVIVDAHSRKTLIRCDWAKWHERQSRVVGNGGVKINSETLKAEAAGFVWDTRAQTLTLLDSAKGLENAQ